MYHWFNDLPLSIYHCQLSWPAFTPPAAISQHTILIPRYNSINKLWYCYEMVQTSQICRNWRCNVHTPKVGGEASPPFISVNCMQQHDLSSYSAMQICHDFKHLLHFDPYTHSFMTFLTIWNGYQHLPLHLQMLYVYDEVWLSQMTPDYTSNSWC